MPDLTGTKISNTYKRLMQVKSSDNAGITSSLQTIQSGDNVDSPLQLSNSTLNVNGTFAIGGVNLTATVSSLNATADITGSQGYVVVSGTNVYKRTFSAGDNIVLTNEDGVASNTGIALTSTVANVKSLGVSAVSATTLDVSKTITSSIVSAVDIRGATVSASQLNAANATIVSTVSAGFFVGDGSGLTNVPSAEGGTVNAVVAGTGLNATVNGVTSTTVNTSGTINVNPNQSLGTVSVSTGLIVPQGAITFSVPVSGTSAVFTGNVSAANIYASTNVFVGGTAVPTASNVAAVSALVSVNTAAITSINAIVGDSIATSAALASVSAAMATSINNTNTALATTSAALATSIGNQLPKAGGAMTGILSATDVICSGVGVDVDALLGKDLRIAKAAVADIVSLTDAASIAIDFNAGQNFAVQLTDNRTLENATNCVPGQTGSIFVIQDGTGSRTLSFGSNYKFPGGTAPTLSTGASAADRIDYITFTSTNIHAVATLNVSTA